MFPGWLHYNDQKTLVLAILVVWKSAPNVLILGTPNRKGARMIQAIAIFKHHRNGWLRLF